MGAQHITDMAKFLALSATSDLTPVRVVRYDEEKKHDARYSFLDPKGQEKVSMTIRSMPGCCGVCLLHSFNGRAETLAKAIKIAITAAKRANYGQVLFTLVSTSRVLEVLRDIPHSSLQAWTNGKTGRVIVTYTVDLKATYESTASDSAGE
jgi:hypothetical protein